MNKILSLAALLCMMFLYGTPACAQDMIEVQPLSFGRFALLNNSGTHSITVTPSNSVTYDPAIIPDVDAERGHYTFTGLPPNVTFALGISVSNPPNDGGMQIDHPSLVSLGGTEPFVLTNFTANTANELVTDGAGNGILYIGATLSTTGNNNVYNDGTYNGTYDITFFY